MPMQMLGNVGKLLLLQEESKPPAVVVQKAVAAPEIGTPVSAQTVASGMQLKSDPGEAIRVPADAEAVLVKAVPPPQAKKAGLVSAVTIGAAALYSLVGDQVLDLMLDLLAQQGAIDRVVTHQPTALALFAVIVWLRDYRRRKREANA